MYWGRLKSYLDKILEIPHCSFSRERILDFENQELKTDCMGIVHLLLQEMKLDRLPSHFRAWETFEYIKAMGATNKIFHLHPGMVFGWRKLNPPQSGDTGHFSIIYDFPVEIPSSSSSFIEYKLKIFEVTKSANGPRIHELYLRTDLNGTLNAVRWDDKKWKLTSLLGIDLFSSKRSRCKRCERVYSLCLCSLLPIKRWSCPGISIIRHPSEKKHPLNTVKLLEFSFENLQLWDTEVMGPDLIAPDTLLLYPSENATELSQISQERLSASPILLLDGTWKKTKKILYQNPWLNKLTHIKVNKEELPQYRIRKELSNQHYSTLEVFTEIWKRKHPENFYKAKRLEEVFSLLINQQIEKMGADRYQSNYQHYPGHSD